MIRRNDKGKLVFDRLGFDIFIDEMISICKTEEEVDWVEMQLQMCLDCQIEEFREKLTDEDDGE